MSVIVVADKKPRGRPRGTGIDDRATLGAVADLIVASPELKPSTAMKRAVQAIKDSHLRRLQDKWKQGSDTWLNAARKRAQQKAAASERQARAARETYGSVPSYGGAINAVDFNQLMDIAESPAMRAMRQFAKSPEMELYRQIRDVNSQFKTAMGMVDQFDILSLQTQHDALMQSILPSSAMTAVNDWQKLHGLVQPKWLQDHHQLMNFLNPLARYRL